MLTKINDTNVEKYIESLSINVETIMLSLCNITFVPELNRFERLEVLCCYNNQLTCLPKLHETLEDLCCSNNKLTSLPKLPETLNYLDCYNNKLTSLPNLPKTLKCLCCHNNQLIRLPELPETLLKIYISHNPIKNIINATNMYDIRKQVNIHNKFIFLYYCLKFKKQLRKWLWERVRLPKIQEEMKPTEELLKKLFEETIEN
jgi:Leucine-rich repeat (LRR) protein